ncbi:hypothetical protein CHLNCDRAFT_135761 [Chlorella variabilis]|uniref:protein-tyrosine sulfotransferase n=1 Tax=Chlorella variabilis TaxID=554065 RepID=E1ZIY4_CHLVA|nr:hypothetical protein CHLNCDRAFT_135761 [Chlorella variabilis]EFN54239.1 hypothetical protein CHLNCDRAFT_135761 [Chlorella variabilis]|eukprot:XP_005846341.1 hypothetical protein CHLNCDRAFT_135761 [Chlorella variabilis]
MSGHHAAAQQSQEPKRQRRAVADVDGGGGGRARGAAAGLRAAAPLQRLQRLVQQARHGAVDSNMTASMVRLAKEVVKGVVNHARNKQPAPGVAANMLESLGRAAAAAAPLRVPRGQLLVERSKLLNAMGRTEAALAATEEAVEVFGAELAAWAAGPEAGTPVNGTGSEARHQAAAALGSLLDVAALWRQLGREERANGVLAEAARVAPLIPSTPNYLRAMAQLSQLTDEQLESALSCMAAVERQTGPAAAGCSWMKLKEAADNETAAGNEMVADLHRLYYAAHRGLHSRKRYAESWRALARAKELHYSKHTYVHRDFEQMVDDMVQLFPSPHKFVTAVAEEAAASPPPAPRSAMHVQSLIASSSARLQRLVARLSRWRRHPDAAAPSGGSQQAQPEAAAEDEAPAEDGGGSSAVPGTGDGSSSTSGSGSSSTGLATSSAGASGSGEMIPIFVMGMPRSGSTLAEQILASHPDVYGAGEHSSLRTVTGTLQELIGESGAGNGTVTPTQLTQMRRRYLAAMRFKIPVEHRGAKWLVDKALSNAWLVGHIALMMPQACLVHAVRHPADASLSAFQQSFFPEKVSWSFNLTNIAAHVKAHHRLMAHWDRVLPGRVLHLHYADMVRDQEGTTRRLVEHCGLPWDPAFLRFYETERSVQTASQLQVKKPIYSSSLNKWPAYKEGLAPLLLRDTILTYEQIVGLPSSQDLLDEVQTQLTALQQQQKEQEEETAATAIQQRLHQPGSKGEQQQVTDGGIKEQSSVQEEQDSTATAVAEAETEVVKAEDGEAATAAGADADEAPEPEEREEL